MKNILIYFNLYTFFFKITSHIYQGIVGWLNNIKEFLLKSEYIILSWHIQSK